MELRAMERGAVLHWTVLGALAVFMLMAVARVVAEFGERATEDAAVRELLGSVETVLTIVLAFVFIGLSVAAAKLRRWLGDMDPRTKGGGPFEVLFLLKHSMVFFESRNVPVGLFGPTLGMLWTEDGMRKG